MSEERNAFARAQVYEGAAPGSNTNILAAGLVPKRPVGRFRVGVILATGSVFKFVVTDGAAAQTGILGTLTAATYYEFTFDVRRKNGTADLTYNFQVVTDGVIDWLTVTEIDP